MAVHKLLLLHGRLGGSEQAIVYQNNAQLRQGQIPTKRHTEFTTSLKSFSVWMYVFNGEEGLTKSLLHQS